MFIRTIDFCVSVGIYNLNFTGVYIRSDNKAVDPAYRGMGIRIEDDILITESGVENLTSMCAKHPDDIENLFKSKTE